MDEKELKTSVKQRIIIGVVALIMVGSMILGYAAIVANGSSSSSQTIDSEALARYQEEYTAAQTALSENTQEDFAVLAPYRNSVATFDGDAAEAAGVVTNDLQVGNGKELTAGDKDYLAYYIGSCPDGSIFDSVFDSNDNPTKLIAVLDPSQGLISGWESGVVGMKLGGIREITIPSAQAYGSQSKICDGKPLRFVVYAVANEEPLKGLAKNLSDAIDKIRMAASGAAVDDSAVSE